LARSTCVQATSRSPSAGPSGARCSRCWVAGERAGERGRAGVSPTAAFGGTANGVSGTWAGGGADAGVIARCPASTPLCASPVYRVSDLHRAASASRRSAPKTLSTRRPTSTLCRAEALRLQHSTTRRSNASPKRPRCRWAARSRCRALPFGELRRARELVEIATLPNRFNLAERASDGVVRECEAAGIGFMPNAPIGMGKARQRRQPPHTGCRAARWSSPPFAARGRRCSPSIGPFTWRLPRVAEVDGSTITSSPPRALAVAGRPIGSLACSLVSTPSRPPSDSADLHRP
jgi:hypothetical protein